MPEDQEFAEAYDRLFGQGESRAETTVPEQVLAESADRLFGRPLPDPGVSDEELVRAAEALFGSAGVSDVTGSDQR